MTATPPDPLASALLPVLIHEMNNATQVLTSLNTLLSMPGGDQYLTERGGDMTSVGEEVVDLGWLLAALASAAGDDMLMTRRHEHGLDVMANYVRKAIRRQGWDSAKAESPLPEISHGEGAGWEAAWALGVFLWSTASAQPGVTAWTWRREESCWIFEAEAPVRDRGATAELLASKLSDVSLTSANDKSELRIPATWLEL